MGRLFPVLIATLLLAAAAAGGERRRIRIGMEDDTPPYSYMNHEGKPAGYTADLLHGIALTAGVDFEIKVAPWRLINADFEAGKLDALANVVITPARRGTMDFSIAHSTLHAVAITPLGTEPIRRSAQLRGKRVCVLGGSVAHMSAQAHNNWQSILLVLTQRDQLQFSVARGDSDVAIVMRPAGDVDNIRPGLQYSILEDLHYQYYMAVHKGDAATLGALNEGLSALISDSALERIASRWLDNHSPRPVRLVDLKPYAWAIFISMAVVVGVMAWQQKVITERRQLTRSLSESEGRLRGLIAQMNAGVQLLDSEGRMIFVNDKALLMLGGTREQVIGRTIPSFHWDVVREDGTVLPSAEYPAMRALTTRQRVEGEVLGVLDPSTSQWKWFQVSAEPLPQDPPEVLVVFHEITAIKRSEQRLRLLAAALEAADIAIEIANAEARIEWVNPAFERLSGYTERELVGGTARVLRPGLLPEPAYQEMRAAADAGRGWTGEFDNTRKDGSAYREEVTITPVRDPSGATFHYISIKRDVTERRLIQQRTVDSQRMEGIGLLASGIAHDLNNILSPIMLSIDILRSRYPGEQECLDLIDRSAKRGADIVRQVLTYSRGMEGERVAVRVPDLIGEVARLIAELLPRNITLSYAASRPNDFIEADPTQMHQVLLNLALNARDAMPAGGKLTFTATREVLGPGHPHLGSQGPPGDYALIKVEDTGEGISPENLPRIFDPFFTTKPRGKGTGLGLSTVHGIIRSHGGFIHVASTPGVGSTFWLYLPRADGELNLGQVTGERPAGEGHGELILIADDEAPILRITQLVLEKHGYKTCLAHDGREAIAMFTARRAEVKLVLLDRMMPNLGGEAAAAAIRALSPTVPIILATGLISDESGKADSNSLAEFGVNHLLRKPFTEERILALIRECVPGPDDGQTAPSPAAAGTVRSP